MTLERLQRTTYILVSIIAAGYLLYIGSTIVVPIIFAILLSVFLNPIDNKLKSIVKVKWLSIVLSFLAIILPILLVTTLFSYQFLNIIDSLPSISEGFTDGLSKLVSRVNQQFPFLNLSTDSLLEKGGESDLQGPLRLVGQGLLSTSTILGSTGLVMIYAFLLLYYKESFKKFIIYTFSKGDSPALVKTIEDIKETIQAYVGGVGLVIIILSVLNTIGLSIIGIEYALFWGALAGLLAIIPFVGTLLGGMLPFIYALSTADATWQPYAVVIYYLIVQQIEGNFITPKIVGNKVDINPLFAIFSLVFFGSFWGMGGIILALPLISILRIIFGHIESTKALAVLMSADITSKKGIFRRMAMRK